MPMIIDDTLPPEQLDGVITHLKSCKDCYDELEINYILKFGLSEERDVNMNFVKQLQNKMTAMEKRRNHFDFHTSMYYLSQITAYTAVAGAFIYVVFNYFLK